jgi:hypothetical protein
MIDQDASYAAEDALRAAMDGCALARAASTADLDVPQLAVDAREHDLDAWTLDLDAPRADLALLAVDRSACGVVLARCEGDLAVCEVAVDACEVVRAALFADLDVREGDVDVLEVDLDVLEVDLDALVADLDVLELDLDVCDVDLDVLEVDCARPFAGVAHRATTLDALDSGVDARITAGAADATRREAFHRVHHTLFLEGSMKLPELHVLDTGQRVQGFLDSEATALGTTVPAPLRGQLDAAVAQGRAAEAGQATLVGSVKGETATQAAIRASITTDFLRPIATAARHALKSAPDFTTLVPPAKLRKADFASTVTAVTTVAAKYQQAFLDHGEPADFVAQLQTAVTQFEASAARRAVLVGQLTAATKSTGESVKTIRSVVKVINGALTPVLKKNAPLKANWVATKRIQATVVTPQPGGDASSTTTTTTPAVTAPVVTAPVKPAA